MHGRLCVYTTFQMAFLVFECLNTVDCVAACGMDVIMSSAAFESQLQSSPASPFLLCVLAGTFAGTAVCGTEVHSVDVRVAELAW